MAGVCPFPPLTNPRKGLDEAAPHPADMLTEQHGAKLVQARRRLVQRTDDRLALGDRERQHLRHPAVGGLEPGAKDAVVDQAGQLEVARVLAVGEPRPAAARCGPNDNGEGSGGRRVESVAGFDFDDVGSGLAGRTDETSRFGYEPNAAGEAPTDELPPGWSNTPEGLEVGAVEATQFPRRHVRSRNSQPWCDVKRDWILDRPGFGVSSSCDEAVGAGDSRCARD